MRQWGMTSGVTRREVLRTAAAAGALASLEALSPVNVLQQALAAAPAHGRLSDIEHVVIFVNENRSFDHYYGTYKGVRGFADPAVPRQADGTPVFAQRFAGSPFGAASAGYGGHLLPFHFDTTTNGECVNDVSHDWAPQHLAWNGGKMDSFLQVDIDPRIDGPASGINTMGYYTRSDLPFYHALADAFTICDRYFGSVIGPTNPNRLYAISATLDPGGTRGGPVLTTEGLVAKSKKAGAFHWTTYPEQLQAKGISWKVYASPEANLGDNLLTYFKPYQKNPRLAKRAFGSSFPGSFHADCVSGRLPQVSWVLAPLIDTEHPPAPVTFGEVAAAQIIRAVTANRKVWAKTAVFMTMDECGGFFDHVPPPVAPPGTPGEYLTAAQLPPEALGIRGPIGLGFRVPMLVISPFSRGGFVCPDTFDHTSMLRFLETRFGPEVPNLSAWRRGVTGDLTSAFNFVAPNRSVPPLPAPSHSDPRVVKSNCPTQAPSYVKQNFPTVAPYPLPPPPQAMPGQEPGSPKRPAGLHGSRKLRKH
ncbi:MAG: phospholipase [Solirubrobacterales bacterium]|nr:phospholipase [Solirubrobacterales bacterium]